MYPVGYACSFLISIPPPSTHSQLVHNRLHIFCAVLCLSALLTRIHHMRFFLIDPYVTSIQLMYAYPLIDMAMDVSTHLLYLSFPPRCRPYLGISTRHCVIVISTKLHLIPEPGTSRFCGPSSDTACVRTSHSAFHFSTQHVYSFTHDVH